MDVSCKARLLSPRGPNHALKAKGSGKDKWAVRQPLHSVPVSVCCHFFQALSPIPKLARLARLRRVTLGIGAHNHSGIPVAPSQETGPATNLICVHNLQLQTNIHNGRRKIERFQRPHLAAHPYVDGS